VDHDALADALANDRLGGAGLDVQTPEPPALDSPPSNDPRVIVTPHTAFCSPEAILDLRERVARQVVDYLQGRRPENLVNPEAIEQRSQ
jgi:D-3-phosphoglycerate dehydrogenase